MAYKHAGQAVVSDNTVEQDTSISVLDDDLKQFEAHGAPPLPPSKALYLVNDGARLWYSELGRGTPVVLLHGGLGHSGNWGHQVPFLLKNGFRVVLIDTRGHGRSTRDEKQFSYELMASDAVAVLDALRIRKAFFVGWSDGACTAMILGAKSPARVEGVFFFACNMDPIGVKPFENTPALDRCFARHQKDYAALSPNARPFS